MSRDAQPKPTRPRDAPTPPSGHPAPSPAASGPPLTFISACALVALAALLLALRKPWALHTPQFWAEDGEIFMNQHDQFGVRAFITPYNGYLHFLPRFIAWFAANVADVAWWPALYNGFTFAASIAVLARLASSRVALPAKPALLLALVLVAGSGEVLLNVTNLQWHVAFFLLLHLFTARPLSLAQRLGDAAILVAVGLNGPFALVFLPFFAWRAWRDRNSDTLLAAALVAACAALQASFVIQAPLPLTDATRAFDAPNLLAVLGNRLVVWPLLGPTAAAATPAWLPAALGLPLLLLFLGWTLRPASLRPIRALLVAVLVLLTAASVYRARADTWDFRDLTSGDRYFHIPRILLAWLLILEWHGAPRFVSWLARGACALGVLSNLPHYTLPAPPDYRWAEHCDPIRRGEPAALRTLPEGYWIDYRGRPPVSTPNAPPP